MLRETCHEPQQQHEHEGVHLMNSFESANAALHEPLSSPGLTQSHTTSNPQVRRCPRASRLMLLAPAALALLFGIVVLTKTTELFDVSVEDSKDISKQVALQLSVWEKAFEEKLDSRMRQLELRLLDVLNQKLDDAGRETTLRSREEDDGQRNRGNGRSRRDVKV